MRQVDDVFPCLRSIVSEENVAAIHFDIVGQ